MHLEPNQARTEFIAVSDRKAPDATARTLQEFAIIDGLPGVNRV
jgi:alkaline phosphatase D